MINGPRGTGVAWNTVTFALLASSEPKVAGRSWWQCLLVLGHLCRRMRVYVCVHLEWIITPLEASASAKWENRSACAFMRKTLSVGASTGFCVPTLLLLLSHLGALQHSHCGEKILIVLFRQSDSFCSWGSCHCNYCRLTQKPKNTLYNNKSMTCSKEKKRH